MADIPIGEIADLVKVDDSGRIPIKKEVLDKMGWSKGDKIAIIPRENHIEIRKAAKIVASIAVVAAAVLASLVFFQSSSAYAQQTVVTSTSQTAVPTGANTTTATTTPNSNQQQQQQPKQTVVTSEPMSWEKSGKSAYLPFRIDITYPEGQSLIQNVTHVTPGSRFDSNIHAAFPSAGLTTYEFTTTNPDEYTIVIGQNYSSKIDQPVTIRFWSGNSTEPDTQTIPIHDTRFLFHFKIRASPEPHIPTPQELNSLNIDYFNKVIQGQNEVKASQSTIDRTISVTANVFQGMTGFAAIMTIVDTFLAIALFAMLRTLKQKQQDLKQLRGTST